MPEIIKAGLLNSEATTSRFMLLPVDNYEAKLIIFAVIAVTGFVMLRWMIRISSDITNICNELTQIHLVFKSRENELTSGRVREILDATVDLKVTSPYWENFLSEILPRNPQNSNAKIQSASKINVLVSPKNIIHHSIGVRKFLSGPLNSAILLAASILFLNCLAAFLAGFYGVDRSNVAQIADNATSLIAGSAVVFMFISGSFIARVFSKLASESDAIRVLLDKHIEFQSEVTRLVQLQRDVSRLTVQVSLVESTLLSMVQAKTSHDYNSARSTPGSRQLVAVSGSTANVAAKKASLDRAASSVRDVVSLIDSACDTISLDIESTYRKLLSKYGNENHKQSEGPKVVIAGKIETTPKLMNSARQSWSEWNVCKKTKPAFDEAAGFLDSAENCVITLTNLKNNIIDLGMTHSDEMRQSSTNSELNAVTNNYILMGDVIAEIRNTIGKISVNNHDVTEAWRNFQNQVENLNRHQKEKLFAARGIVSNCFKTVSSQMNQIQVDLNNHLRNISTTIGQQ